MALKAFAESSLGYGRVNYSDSPEYNGTMRSFSAGVGCQYQLKDRFSLELILPYANLHNVDFKEETMVGNTFIPTLGVQYRLFR